jgi:hypothetical protein
LPICQRKFPCEREKTVSHSETGADFGQVEDIVPGGGLFSLYKGSPALEIYGDYIQASTQVAGVARPDRL